MKKTLLKKFPPVKKPQFYLSGIVLLCISGFSYAKSPDGVLPKAIYATASDAKQYAATVKGKVTDSSTGESLPGVSVKVKGTTIGTVTDLNGNFILQVPENARVHFPGQCS